MFYFVFHYAHFFAYVMFTSLYIFEYKFSKVEHGNTVFSFDLWRHIQLVG